MPYDPNFPTANTHADAAQMRAQLNGLKDLIDGIPGLQGEPGVQGPAFANAVIDSITTLNPGESATVSVFFDGYTVHFSFGIPRGAQGEQGIQGAPGELTNAALGDAIASAIEGTPKNTNGVATMDAPFTNDPPTLADLELMRAKVNELITARGGRVGVALLERVFQQAH